MRPKTTAVTQSIAALSDSPIIFISGRETLNSLSVQPSHIKDSRAIMIAIMMPNILASRMSMSRAHCLRASRIGAPVVRPATPEIFPDVSPRNWETISTVTIAAARRTSVTLAALIPDRCWISPSIIRLCAIKTKTAISVICPMLKGRTVIVAMAAYTLITMPLIIGSAASLGRPSHPINGFSTTSAWYSQPDHCSSITRKETGIMTLHIQRKLPQPFFIPEMKAPLSFTR